MSKENLIDINNNSSLQAEPNNLYKTDVSAGAMPVVGASNPSTDTNLAPTQALNSNKTTTQASAQTPVETAPLIDYKIEKPVDNFLAQSMSPTNTLEPKPKKSKLWIVLIILIILVAIGLGIGYWLYNSKTVTKNSDLVKYQKGPDLPVLTSDIENGIFQFEYNAELDAIIYQKSDKNIYADYFALDKKNFMILDTLGANLITLSPDGNYAVIYYPEAPVIKDTDAPETKNRKNSLATASENYFLANLKNNNLYALGSDLKDFIWSENNLYFMKGTTEMWTYDFKMQDYTGLYDPSVQVYYKVFDFTKPIIAMSSRAHSNLIYTISNVLNSDKNYTLYTFDPKTKQFTKLFDTQAVSIQFSRTGSYYTLFNPKNKNTSIYESETNTLVTEITDVNISPSKLVWSADEKDFYYFGVRDTYTSDAKLNKYDPVGFYKDLVKYNLESKNKNIVISGTSKNIANPTDFDINLKNNMLSIKTDQSSNIYQMELK